MNVSIGRAELLALVISITKFGPDIIKPEYKPQLEKRPFTNGDHYRFKESFLEVATEEQLFEIYSSRALFPDFLLT